MGVSLLTFKKRDSRKRLFADTITASGAQASIYDAGTATDICAAAADRVRALLSGATVIEPGA